MWPNFSRLQGLLTNGGIWGGLSKVGGVYSNFQIIFINKCKKLGDFYV
jgi:hypothetical protein